MVPHKTYLHKYLHYFSVSKKWIYIYIIISTGNTSIYNGIIKITRYNVVPYVSYSRYYEIFGIILSNITTPKLSGCSWCKVVDKVIIAFNYEVTYFYCFKLIHRNQNTKRKTPKFNASNVYFKNRSTIVTALYSISRSSLVNHTYFTLACGAATALRINWCVHIA